MVQLAYLDLILNRKNPNEYLPLSMLGFAKIMWNVVFMDFLFWMFYVYKFVFM